MATYKNMYFKEVSYKKNKKDCLGTSDFNQIILNTSSKPLSNKKKNVKHFMTKLWKKLRFWCEKAGFEGDFLTKRGNYNENHLG